MKNTEFFCEALDRYTEFPSRETALELYRACGAVWNESSEVPFNARQDIRDQIPSWIDCEHWEANGRTYAGAAGKIRAALKKEYDFS
ncbi:hypothetical protein AL036_16425 [Salipiger aestuarii]|uniref:hypothetical protein n=1 Tax=Salipiger aestuarii TaxID=568098 RepID=UPI00123C6711|nr:hypothetical protein [Salipiger aestuarii]KAA8606031.1 hypothetical protein AL036_16425 [Salipiger aestuarii]